jgi:hypothetical protein
MSAADDEVERMTELWRAAHTVHPPAATVSSPDHAGFLQKRGEKAALGLVSRGRRPWARRWFTLSRGLLFYFEQPGAGAFKGCLRLNGAVVGTWGGSLVGALFACLFALFVCIVVNFMRGGKNMRNERAETNTPITNPY